MGGICGCPGSALGLRASQGKQEDEGVPAGTSHVPSAPPPWAGCSCKHLQCPESTRGFPKHLLLPKASPSQQPVRRSGRGEESGWGCLWTGRLEGGPGPRMHPTEPGIFWPLGWFLTPLGEPSPSHVPGMLLKKKIPHFRQGKGRCSPEEPWPVPPMAVKFPICAQ